MRTNRGLGAVGLAVVSESTGARLPLKTAVGGNANGAPEESKSAAGIVKVSILPQSPPPAYGDVAATPYLTSKVPELIDRDVLPGPVTGLPPTIRYAASKPVFAKTRFGTLREAAAVPSPSSRARSSVPVVASPSGPAGGEEQFAPEKQGVNWLSEQYMVPGISWRAMVNGPVVVLSIRVRNAVLKPSWNVKFAVLEEVVAENAKPEATEATSSCELVIEKMVDGLTETNA